jgi:sodium-dependent phosphate cotransporter
VAKKVIILKDAVPFILGANIGTTVTAFIAAGFNSNSAISIAIAHFIINFCGVVIFMIIPFVKQVPLWLALKLGRLTRKYRLVGFLYILLVFFFLPFSLIYFHKGQTHVIEATYEKTVFPTGQKSNYTIVMRKGDRKTESTWMMYEPENGNLSQVLSVYRKENVLLIDNEIYEFKQPGFCRDNINAGKSHQLCVDRIVPQYSTKMTAYDSVFVFKGFPIQYQQQDSTLMVVFISPKESLVLRREWLNREGTIIELNELVRLDYK